MGNWTSSDFFAAKPSLKREVVPIPEMPAIGSVLVQELTGEQRSKYEASMVVMKGKNRDRRELNFEHARGLLVAMSVINDDGTRKFTDQDVPALNKLGSRILDRIYSVAQRLSAITDADIDELGSGSGETRPVSLLSGSPSESEG